MFKKFNLQEMKNKFSDVDHQVIYINYNKKEGIKILKNIKELLQDDLKHFHKIFIFNDEVMITATLFDRDDIRYSETHREEFINIERFKEFYLEKCAYKKLKVRIGKTKDGIEKIQYIELRGEA